MTDRDPSRGGSDLTACIIASELFETLDGAVLQDLVDALERVILRDGEFLYHQGDASDSLYVVARGQIRMLVTEGDGTQRVLGEFGRGQTVGEMGLLTGAARAATALSVGESELARWTREALDCFAGQHPGAAAQVGRSVIQRFRVSQLLSLGPRLLGVRSADALEDLIPELEWLDLDRGQVLVREGDHGDDLWFVVSGRLAVTVRDEEGAERVVGEVLSGETVGEMQVLTGEPAEETVYAVRDSVLVRFAKDSFDRLVSRQPEVLRNLARLVIGRLQRAVGGAPAARKASALAVDIALVPAHPGVPLGWLADRLGQALESIGATLRLDAGRFDHEIGLHGAAQTPTDDPTDVRLVAWLNDQETRYRFILFQADAGPSDWTSRCLRQADQILIVGDAGADPQPGEVERSLARAVAGGPRVRQRLVLVHPGDCQRPEGTARWLAPREVAWHHHIRQGNDADVERLARHITGRALSLVLGGGGARGFAHLGVLRALDEAGVAVDLVGGNSMGAIISAQYALGLDYETMIDGTRQLTRFDQVFDLTLPLVALTATRRKVRNGKRIYGEQTQIEDLWMPYFCVSSNITRAELVVHRTGSLWRSVFASATLPGIVPPTVQDGDLLVDGAFLDNLPMGVAHGLSGGGTVIAVDVSPAVDLTGNEPYEYLSGWSVLWSRINPFIRAKAVPNIATIMQRVTDVGSIRTLKSQVRAGVADLYLSPPVEQFELLDFGALDEIAQLGYDYAKPVIDEWLHSKDESG